MVNYPWSNHYTYNKYWFITFETSDFDTKKPLFEVKLILKQIHNNLRI